MRVRSLIVALSLFVIAQCQGAQDTNDIRDPLILFDKSQFGKVDVQFPESFGVGEDFEALINGDKYYESVIDLETENLYRNIGRSVARLQALGENAAGEQVVWHCTSTRISEDLILTNGHCVEYLGFRALEMRALFGYLETGSSDFDTASVDNTPVDLNHKLDYAILRLKDLPSLEKFPPLDPKIRAARNGESVFILHHPLAQPQKLSRFQCKVKSLPSETEDRLIHICDTQKGSSGALLLALSDQTFLALHHAGSASDKQNFAIPISEIKQDSKAFPSPAFPLCRHEQHGIEKYEVVERHYVDVWSDYEKSTGSHSEDRECSVRYGDLARRYPDAYIQKVKSDSRGRWGGFANRERFYSYLCEFEVSVGPIYKLARTEHCK